VADAPSAPIDAIRGLAVLAEPPGPEHGSISAALGFECAPTSPRYSDLFLFQLYPYASVYLGPEGMMGGVARERIAGFWHAVGLVAPAEPDHLAALLGLYASLMERARPESLEGDDRGGDRVGAGPVDAESILAAEAAGALLSEHLAPWVFAWLERMQDLASGTYAAWASMLYEVLAADYRAFGSPSSDLQHLRDAPPLPDPRTEGTAPFLDGLLAPVRSGIIVTRADLAAMARRLDLGLRAGERRYALEHLLAQDPEQTLGALSDAARRQAADHELRAPWLGESARFLAERARKTGSLCEELIAAGIA